MKTLSFIDNRLKKTGFPLILCLLLSTASTHTLAQKLSPSEAASSARELTDGKVLNIKKVPARNIDNNSEAINYKVRVLSPEGRVQHIIVDGDDGSAHYRAKNKKHKKPKN